MSAVSQTCCNKDTMMALVGLLQIPEIFEAILFQLPLRDLLLLQRVSRTWRDTIAASPTLQKKLFFRPVSPSAEPELNPLLREVFPPFFVLSEVPDPWNFLPDTKLDRLKEMGWYSDESRRKNVLSEEASWRLMFPVQPPAQVHSVKRQGSCICGPVSKLGWVQDGFWDQEDEGGIRMGGLWDIVIHMVDGVRDGEFFVEWRGFPVRTQDMQEVRRQLNALGYRPEDEDQRKAIMEGAAWTVLPARRNAIVVHNEYNRVDCYPGPPIPCGFSIVELYDTLIQWEELDL